MSTSDGPNGSESMGADWGDTPATPATPPVPPSETPFFTSPAGPPPSPVGGQPELPSYGEAPVGSWGATPAVAGSTGALFVGAEPAPRKRWLVPLLIGLVVVVILASVGGFVVWKKLASHGTHADALVPATAIEYAEIDLDPAADQKLKVLAQLRKLPTIKDKLPSDSGDLKGDLIKKMLGTNSQINYDTDIKPWLGDRVAIAVLPGSGTPTLMGGPQTLIFVQHKDKAKAEAAIKKLIAAHGMVGGLSGGGMFGGGMSGVVVPSSSATYAYASATAAPGAPAALPKDLPSGFPTDMPTDFPSGLPTDMPTGGTDTFVTPAMPAPGYAVLDEYIVYGADQKTVDAAVASAKTESLKDSAHYKADIAKLGGNQIFTTWVDLGALVKSYASLMGASANPSAAGIIDGLGKLGRVVEGAHATNDGFELTGRWLDNSFVPDVKGRSADALSKLPADTKLAIYMANPGDYVTAIFDAVKKAVPQQQFDAFVQQAGDKFGMKVPGDLADLLGSDALVAAKDTTNMLAPSAGVRLHSKDPKQSLALLQRLAGATDSTNKYNAGLRVAGDNVVWASDDAYGQAFAAGNGSLGDSAHFKKAMALNGDVLGAVFVDFDVAGSRTPDIPGGAVGVTVIKDGADMAFTVRVVLD